MEKVSMQRRACPELGGKKCIAEKCCAWDEGPLVDQSSGAPVEKWAAGCVLYFWAPIWQRETCARLNGTQKGVESLRNQEHAIYNAFNEIKSQAMQFRLEKKVSEQ